MQLMFCPGCGKHWDVSIAFGGWIRTHTACDEYLGFCNDVEHDLFTRDEHQVEHGPSWPMDQEVYDAAAQGLMRRQQRRRQRTGK